VPGAFHAGLYLIFITTLDTVGCTGEGGETKRGKVPCPRSHSREVVVVPGFDPEFFKLWNMVFISSQVLSFRLWPV
jgi:hypothetical protein